MTYMGLRGSMKRLARACGQNIELRRNAENMMLEKVREKHEELRRVMQSDVDMAEVERIMNEDRRPARVCEVSITDGEVRESVTLAKNIEDWEPATGGNINDNITGAIIDIDGDRIRSVVSVLCDAGLECELENVFPIRGE